MIYNYITSKSIISKVLTDLDLQKETHRISDMIEWVGEAVEKIGGFPYYNIKVTGKDNVPLLTVANYQSKLPDDLHKILEQIDKTLTVSDIYRIVEQKKTLPKLSNN